MPATWFAWTSDILANADGVIVTGINTIPGLRQIAEALSAVRSLRSGAGRLAVVINRYQPTLTGAVARRNHVESVLHNEQVFYVRADPATMAESINIGSPVVVNSASRKTAREIGAVATFCAETKSIRVASG
jgi:Flp pilus assembly CpaE family ATPase